MNKDFSVPKTPIELQILREGASGFHPCRLFLSTVSRHHHGPETVSEYLNETPDFVPVEMDGKVTILNIRHVVAFRDASEMMEDNGRIILLTLKSERLFTVQLGGMLPKSQGRTQDYLNHGDVFLEFVHEKARLFLNRNMIVSAADQ